MCIESHAYPWYPFHDITWNRFCVSSHKSSQLHGSMLQKCKWYWHYHTALQSEAQLFHLPIIPYTGQWKPYSQPLCSGVPGHPQRSTSSYINPWYCPPPPILPPQASSLMLACLPQLRPPELTAARTSHHKFYLLHAWYKLSPIYDIHFATVFKYLHF